MYIDLSSSQAEELHIITGARVYFVIQPISGGSNRMNQYKYDSAWSSEKWIQIKPSDIVLSPSPNSNNTPRRFKKPAQVYIFSLSTLDTDLPKNSTQEIE